MGVDVDSNELILTVNRRLAQTLRAEYDQQQSQLAPVWESIEVLPLNSWLKQIWAGISNESARLLTPAQELHLWIKIIQETAQDYPLLQIDNTAQLIQQAWELLHYWQLPLDMIKNSEQTPEVRQFLNWLDLFVDYCQQHNWLSEAVLPGKLEKTGSWVKSFILHKKIRLAGFDELTPAHESLINSLRQLTEVTEIQMPIKITQKRHFVFSNLETELLHMADWAKNQITTHPNHRIACIIPELTEIGPLVKRIFTLIFHHQPSIFNVSAGQSLDQYEMIAIGLQVLKLNLSKIPMESLEQIMQSPYLCQNKTDINFGAVIDSSCRDLRKFDINLAALFKVISQWQDHYPGQTWLKRFRALAALQNELKPSHLPSAWVGIFIQALAAIGWPGGRSMDSTEYQLINRWQELLAEFAELDCILGEISYNSALQSLQRLTSLTIFQPKKPDDSPIQIMGLLESSGLQFQAIWVMGLDDRSWPPVAKPNPFLPYNLQIKWQLPHACAERELVFAQKIIQRLLHSANEITFSCSADDDNDQPIYLSSLLACQSYETITEKPLIPRIQQIFDSSLKENIVDDQGPPLSVLENIHGGSKILTYQAECAFRAFAVFRLKAQSFAQPELGISSLQHGILIHGLLEKIWKKLKNQLNLLALSKEELQKWLIILIDQTINEEISDTHPVFILIEKNRLLKIITDWLELEKKRPPFQVLEEEVECSVQLAGITFNLKIDRIDQLSNGVKLLIDYKTGTVKTQSWLGDRPQQPQMPLYALSFPQNNFHGVTFAQLQTGNLGFEGLHSEGLDTQTNFPKGMVNIAHYKDNKDLITPKTWSGLLSQWSAVLQKLSLDFNKGWAIVHPDDQGKPCGHCELQILCRISSQAH